MKQKILALIGLRSGSKGLKNKNIKILGSKHLCGWIITSAKKSKYINRVIVSTDSAKYSKIAISYGAEVPFLRPKEISKDRSNEIEFINHAISYLKKKENYTPDIIVRLLATSPFQKYKDIDLGIKKIIQNKHNSVAIISSAKQHPMKALKIKNNKLVNYFTNKGTSVGSKNNRQEYEKAYFRSNVLICKTKILKKYKSLTDNNVGYILIDNSKHIDIDNKFDFKFAEFLLKKKLI